MLPRCSHIMFTKWRRFSDPAVQGTSLDVWRLPHSPSHTLWTATLLSTLSAGFLPVERKAHNGSTQGLRTQTHRLGSHTSSTLFPQAAEELAMPLPVIEETMNDEMPPYAFSHYHPGISLTRDHPSHTSLPRTAIARRVTDRSSHTDNITCDCTHRCVRQCHDPCISLSTTYTRCLEVRSLPEA